MFPNILNLSGKSNSNSQNSEGNPPLDLLREQRVKDRFTGDETASLELAENEIWQGIKAEQSGHLETAAVHYRAAIKSNPESAKAYRLLANVLKRIRQNKAQVNKLAKVKVTELKNQNLTNNKLATKLQLTTERLEPVSDAIASSPQVKAVVNPISSASTPGTLDFSNLDLLAISTANQNLNSKVNNFNSVTPTSDDMVLLPNIQMSESGKVVLQESLSVAQVYVQQALVFFEQKEWGKSIDSCQEALRVCPNLGEAYKIWGNCLQQSGNSAEAIGIYAKALEAQPNMAEIYCNLGSIYARSQKWQQAIEHYQKSTIIDPNSAAAYRNLARVWDDLGEYDKAEDCFFKALAIEPQLISAKEHFALAHNLATEERLEQAIACYKYCIQLEPHFLNAYVRLAQILERIGNKEEALYYYKKLAQLQTEKNRRDSTHSRSRQQIRRLLAGGSKPALPPAKSVPKSGKVKALTGKTNKPLPQLQPATPKNPAEQIALHRQQIQQQPNSPTPYIELGNLYFRAQKWQNALGCYSKAVKVAPKQAKYQLILAKALEKIGETAKADRVYYQAFSLEPDKISANKHFALANRLLEQKQIKPAIACYRRAISIQPDLVEAYWQLGKILLGLEQTKGAFACFQQSIRVNPHHPRGYQLLGSAFAQVEDWQTTLKCYLKAAQINPNDGEIQHNLGETHTKLEQWQDAVDAYIKAIAINANNSWSYNNLGNAYLKLEQWQQAADSFRQAIALKPDFVWSHYNLGEAASKLQQWDEALAAYQKAKKIEPNLADVNNKIARLLHRRSQQSQQEALEFCQSQLQEDPENIELYHQAIALDRQNPDLYLDLGRTLVKQNKLDEAVVIYQTGLKWQPHHLELSMELAAILTEQRPNSDLNNVISQLETVAPLSANYLHNQQSNFEESDRYLLQLPCHPKPVVSIVIPVFNQIDYTFKCLHSIANTLSDDFPAEIIVVNDCSTDKTADILQQVRGLKQIDNQENLGFLQSCNRGIEAAEGEFVYLLNNDTELKPEALAKLLEVAQEDCQVGAVGSKLLYADGSLQEAGGIIWQDGTGWNYGRQDNPLTPQYNYLRPVDYCSAASLLVRKTALTALGGFDPLYTPAYYEDTDLCFAIRHQLGLKIIYQPQSEVIHHEGISCGTDLNNGVKSYQTVNLRKFQQKWSIQLQEHYPNTGIEGVPAASRRFSGNKTILVIDIYPPCYDKESGARRMWRLLRIFKELNYHVIFLPDNGAKETPYVPLLQSQGIEIIYTESGYGTELTEQLAALLPIIDLAWICRPQLYEKYAPIIRQQEQIKLIYDTVDLHYLRMQRAAKLGDNSIDKMREWVRMQSRELQAAHDADLTIAIAEPEQEILTQQQVKNVAVVSNIHQPYRGEKPDFDSREGLLFIGSYNHPPNLDGVVWLVQEIMPLVWAQLPKLNLTLLGSNTKPEVTALGEDPRVTVTGYIPDVSSYFLSHRVFVAPLRYGAGMKGKIGQSLEYGLPLVSTNIGIEGMNLTPEKDVLEANHTEEFASQIIRLYGDKNLWNELAVNSEKAIAPFTVEQIKSRLQPTLKSLID